MATATKKRKTTQRSSPSGASLMRETKRIQQMEKRIEREERKILATENRILKQTGLAAVSRRTISAFHRVVLRRFERKRFMFGVIVTIGVVLLWHGIWNLAEATILLEYPLLGIVVGLGILWLTRRIPE